MKKLLLCTSMLMCSSIAMATMNLDVELCFGEHCIDTTLACDDKETVYQDDVFKLVVCTVEHEDSVAIDCQVFTRCQGHEDELVSHPKIITKWGEKATICVESDDGEQKHSLKLAVTPNQ